MDWFNKDLRREIYLGKNRSSHSKFVMLEDENDESSTVSPGDQELIDFDKKWNPE
jgi:hypothetical protein